MTRIVSPLATVGLSERTLLAESLCTFLNDVSAVDNNLVRHLVIERQLCTGALHEALDLGATNGEGQPVCGLLGLMNEFLGPKEDGMGLITCETPSDQSRVNKFYVTPDFPRKEVE